MKASLDKDGLDRCSHKGEDLMDLTISNYDLKFSGNITPTHNLVISDGIREVIRIMKDGRVVLAPGLTLDEASSAFWRAIEELSPGICARILDERAK